MNRPIPKPAQPTPKSIPKPALTKPIVQTPIKPALSTPKLKTTTPRQVTTPIIPEPQNVTPKAKARVPTQRQIPLDTQNEENILRSAVPNIRRDQITDLLALKYITDGTLIINPKRKDVLIEIIGMLLLQPYPEVIEFLSEATDPDYILWDQESMNEGRVNVAREIAIQQAEEVGVKGVGKCRYCTSNELVFAQKQIRSGDEPMTIFVRCIACRKQWRQ